jgi:hypothetical protein
MKIPRPLYFRTKKRDPIRARRRRHERGRPKLEGKFLNSGIPFRGDPG